MPGSSSSEIAPLGVVGLIWIFDGSSGGYCWPLLGPSCSTCPFLVILKFTEWSETDRQDRHNQSRHCCHSLGHSSRAHSSWDQDRLRPGVRRSSNQVSHVGARNPRPRAVHLLACRGLHLQETGTVRKAGPPSQAFQWYKSTPRDCLKQHARGSIPVLWGGPSLLTACSPSPPPPATLISLSPSGCHS